MEVPWKVSFHRPPAHDQLGRLLSNQPDCILEVRCPNHPHVHRDTCASTLEMVRGPFFQAHPGCTVLFIMPWPVCSCVSLGGEPSRVHGQTAAGLSNQTDIGADERVIYRSGRRSPIRKPPLEHRCQRPVAAGATKGRKQWHAAVYSYVQHVETVYSLGSFKAVTLVRGPYAAPGQHRLVAHPNRMACPRPLDQRPSPPGGQAPPLLRPVQQVRQVPQRQLIALGAKPGDHPIRP